MLLAGQLDSEAPLVFDPKFNHFCWRFEGCCFQVSSDEDCSLQAQNPHKQLHSEEPCLSAPCHNANTHCTASYRSFCTPCDLNPSTQTKTWDKSHTQNATNIKETHPEKPPAPRGLESTNLDNPWSFARSIHPWPEEMAKTKGAKKHMGIPDPKNCIKQSCDVHWNLTFNSHEAFSGSLHLCV